MNKKKIDSNHSRAKSNLEYYENALNNQLKEMDFDKQNTAFENPRPESVLGQERDLYESLCRSDEHVFKNVDYNFYVVVIDFY
jgi:hypothetical protein